MAILLGLLALTAATLLAGAAFAVRFVDRPPRPHLDSTPRRQQWLPSDEDGAVMQAPLWPAIVSR